MPVPDFQSLMLPILKLAADGQVHRLKDAVATMADRFNLNLHERNELLPKSGETRIYKNVGWAITYLKRSKLLESAGRGVFRITQRGREVLKQNPPRIDIQYLRKFPEFSEFLNKSNRSSSQAESTQTVESTTPDDQLESGYRAHQQALAQELLERIMDCSLSFFEKLIVDLLVAMGYGGSAEETGRKLDKSSDEGVHGLIKGDVLGFDQVYVQAKRWKDVVGKPIVQGFEVSLTSMRAERGALITTSYFSKEAQDYIKYIGKKIVLIDGEQLAQLMIDYNVGVAEERRYVIKRIDSDYFEEG